MVRRPTSSMFLRRCLNISISKIIKDKSLKFILSFINTRACNLGARQEKKQQLFAVVHNNTQCFVSKVVEKITRHHPRQFPIHTFLGVRNISASACCPVCNSLSAQELRGVRWMLMQDITSLCTPSLNSLFFCFSVPHFQHTKV